jgi:hypothetical protein
VAGVLEHIRQAPGPAFPGCLRHRPGHGLNTKITTITKNTKPVGHESFFVIFVNLVIFVLSLGRDYGLNPGFHAGLNVEFASHHKGSTIDAIASVMCA